MKNTSTTKNKILKIARTSMCSSKIHLDRKKQSKKTGIFR